MKSVKVPIGEITCLGPKCNHTVPVFKDSNTGSLSFSCMWCRAPGYAKNDGSQHYNDIMEQVELNKAAKAVPTEPVIEKKPFSVFG